MTYSLDTSRIKEIIQESWDNAAPYHDLLMAYTLDQRVDDMMDCDAEVAQFPRHLVKEILGMISRRDS